MEQELAQSVKDIIQKAVNEVNDTLPNPVDLDFTKNTVLFGEDGIFDSISLVTLILNIEEMLQDQLNVSLVLANEKAMSRTNSPFKSTENLFQYIMETIRAENQ